MLCILGISSPLLSPQSVQADGGGGGGGEYAGVITNLPALIGFQ